MKRIAVVCKDFQDFVNYMQMELNIFPLCDVVKLSIAKYTAIYTKQGLKSKSFTSVNYTDFAHQNKDFSEIDKIVQLRIK